MARIYTVQGRAGTANGILNGRTIRAGETYELTQEEFENLSFDALVNNVLVVSALDQPAARGGVDLTINSATVPTGLRVGRVLKGVRGNDVYKLVRFVDAADAGDVLVRTANDNEVTTVHTADSLFAGIATAAVTAGNYGFIQIDGHAPRVNIAGATPDTPGELLTVGAGTNGLAAITTVAADAFGVVTGTGTAYDSARDPFLGSDANFVECTIRRAVRRQV